MIKSRKSNHQKPLIYRVNPIIRLTIILLFELSRTVPTLTTIQYTGINRIDVCLIDNPGRIDTS